MTKISTQNVHETLRRHMLADGFDMVLDLEKSRGAILHDARANRDYLDLFSFYAAMPLGFGHPLLQDPAYQARLLKVAQLKPANSDVYTVELAEFVDTFARVATRGAFPHHFFIEGGSLGVENALKIAFDWKARKNMARGLGIGKQKVIHFVEAFHGRSGYTLSLTNTYDPKKYQYFPMFDWPRVSNPKQVFPLTAASEADVIAREAQSLAEIDRVIAEGAEDIACLIIEPIQAEGGDNHFRREFLQALRDRADKHEFLLIFDEVQTGGGLCGTMWAHEAIGVQPDVISFGKKFQIGGCASTRRIEDIPDHVFAVSSRINSTYGGNLTDMVRSTRYLEIIEQEKLLDNVVRVGGFLKEGLLSLASRWSEIGNVRGRGLFLAFDFADAKQRDVFRQEMFARGALCISCGPRSIRLRPVLDFSMEDASRALSLFEESLAACYGPRG